MSEFAAVSESLLLDEEFVLLDPDYQHIWFVVITSNIGERCGIFKGGTAVISQQSSRPLHVVKAAFDEFIKLGWIVEDDGYFWIRSRIKHRGHNGNWRAGALNDARTLTTVTPLAQRCLDYYREYYNAVGTPSGRRRDAVGTPSRSKAKQSKANTSNRDANASRSPADPESADPGYSPDQLALAERMDADIERLKADGFAVGNGWRRRPEQVALSLVASGIPTGDITAAWEWGLRERYWKSQLVKQVTFVQSPAPRWAELVNQWRARTQRNTGQAPVSGSYADIDSASEV